jgi:hypothetical protein
MSLKIIQPITITDAALKSSDIPENDHPAWTSATTYGFGDRVILVSNHKVYESLQSSNTNKPPSGNQSWWAEVKPTNRWAAFDTSNSTKTVTAGGASPKITYELKTSSVDSVAVLNISGGSAVNVTVTHPVYGEVFTESVSLLGLPTSSDWWSWFFGQRSGPTQVVITGLPRFVEAILKIEVIGNSALSIGAIVIGELKKIGTGVLSNARLGIQDYSRKEKNIYGDTVLVERAFAKRANFDILIQSSEIDSTIDFLTSVRAKPCLWIGGSVESLTVYGFYRSFEVLLKYATHSEFQLELEGLT